jgi:membrane associated rhomboid family serine protease
MSPTRRPQPEPRRAVATPVFALLASIWLVELIDALTRRSLDGLGIEPRSVSGLVGVPLAPLLHGGFAHLLANTVPLLVLGLLVSWRSRTGFWEVTVWVVVLGGLGVWLLGAPSTITIGASGLVFGYLTYLMASGFRARHWIDVVLAVGVVLVYGGLLWGALPGGVPAGVSWLAHLTGAAAGVFVAYREP